MDGTVLKHRAWADAGWYFSEREFWRDNTLSGARVIEKRTREITEEEYNGIYANGWPDDNNR